MGDNGKEEQKPQEKTEEQLKQERLERYQKNPGMFFESTEIIFAALNNPQEKFSPSILVGKCSRAELDVAQVELNHRINMIRHSMDIESQMKAQVAKELITPAHGIRNFMRRKH